MHILDQYLWEEEVCACYIFSLFSGKEHCARLAKIAKENKETTLTVL